MSSLRIAVAPGDGIGPEIMNATLDLFREAGVDRAGGGVEFVPVEAGAAVFSKGNSRGLTDEAVAQIESCGILLKGPMETPSGSGGKSINVTMRKLFSTYANLRTFKSLPGVETIHSRAGIPIDMVVVRENIEDTYGGVEHRLSNDMIQCKRLISAPGCDAIHGFAFRTAEALGIPLVHCGHKANIMKMTDGLFLDRFRAVAAEYPAIQSADVIVDALCMNLVVDPTRYRMIVLPNLQGDIVSDLCAGLVGGLGFAPSANIGKHIAIFEAVHGTAPDIAGKGIANPTSLILSGLMLLRHLGLSSHAATIENALLTTLESGVHTGDFNRSSSQPPVNTERFTRAIKDNLGNKPTTVAPASDRGSASNAKASAPNHLKRLPRPTTPEFIRTFVNSTSKVVGCDVYLDSTIPPFELAAELEAICADSPFRLTMVSNRGTQVWPTGSVYTECVDYYRARFEPRTTPDTLSLPLSHAQPASHPQALTSVDQLMCLRLLVRLAERFVICSYELLREFDGKRGFSLAQGQ